MANLSQSFKKDLTVGLILTLLVGRKRGAGVPGCGKHGLWKTLGVENTESGGKHGVWWKTLGLVQSTRSQWKTRGLSEKHWGTIISPNNEFFSLK